MKQAFVVLTALSFTVPAYAQVTSSPTSSVAAAPTPNVPSSTTANTDEAAPGAAIGIKPLRASCRDEARAKGLKGVAKRQAVSACVVQQRPDLASREQCRSDGFSKGLRKQELHAFVKDCLKTKG